MDFYGWRLESMPTLVGGAWNRPFWGVKKSHFNGHLHPLNALKIYTSSHTWNCPKEKTRRDRLS